MDKCLSCPVKEGVCRGESSKWKFLCSQAEQGNPVVLRSIVDGSALDAGRYVEPLVAKPVATVQSVPTASLKGCGCGADRLEEQKREAIRKALAK